MDPSKEECHSSESGWTMYLGSPASYGDENDSNREDESRREAVLHEVKVNKDHDDDDDDDSMASDASSGPSNMVQPLGARGVNLRHDEIPMMHHGDEDEDSCKCPGVSEKKHKSKNKKKKKKNKATKKSSAAAAAAAADTAAAVDESMMRREEDDGVKQEENSINGDGNIKVRINSFSWMGKRK